MKYLIPILTLSSTTLSLASGNQDNSTCCCGIMTILPIAYLCMLTYVFKEAKNRNMESALWGIIILITGPIGFIIFESVKTGGKLIPCHKCNNKRLEASCKCPHCGVE